jgi:hypothetical protein
MVSLDFAGFLNHFLIYHFEVACVYLSSKRSYYEIAYFFLVSLLSVQDDTFHLIATSFHAYFHVLRFPPQN